MTARICANTHGGRDFVVGDVHGDFDTLEALLVQIEFDAAKDRLFALGDLIDRGPRSLDARAWLKEGRIALSVRGNHEEMLDRALDTALETFNGTGLWHTYPWLAPAGRVEDWFAWQDLEDWIAWRDLIAAMPIAATVETADGDVGLIHASPTARHWRETLRALDARDASAINAALWSPARAHGKRLLALMQGVPVEGDILGVRAVLTGHAVGPSVRRTANVWHIDTGAGVPSGQLTIAQIDIDPMTFHDAEVHPAMKHETERHWDSCSEVERNPKKLSGARVFKDTRLPQATLYEHLADGASIQDIVDWFPGVEEAQLSAVLRHDAQSVIEDDERTAQALHAARRGRTEK